MARRDNGNDDDFERSCSISQDNESSIETGDHEGGGLLGINNLIVGLDNLSLIDNLLCGSNVLNDLNIAVLGSVDDDDDDDDDGDSEVECSVEQDNESEIETGDSEMGGLISLNNVGVNANNVSALDNALCGSNVANDANVAVLGSVDDDDDDDGRGDSDVECSIEQDNDSEIETGDAGLFGLIGLNNVVAGINNLGLLGNVGCGANILNGLDVAILGRA
ncbi:MAG: hypothetical protein ACRDY7_09355 [Acidimicrobiia bacterium]